MKGFVITIDAIMALTIASMIFAIILDMLPQTAVNILDKKQMFNIVTDILSVMDSSGKLNSYVGKSSSFVNQDLGYYIGLMPQTFCGNLTVKTYNGNTEPPISFSLDTTYNNFTAGCPKKNDIVKVKRMFVNYPNKKFGLAEFELWLR